MKKIKLTQNQYAIVDDWNYNRLSQWKWYANRTRNLYYYAQRGIRVNGKRSCIQMQREIYKLKIGNKCQIDHIDGNTLNNREINLRKCTSQQNIWNRHRIFGKSKYKGVLWHKKNRKWTGQIVINYKKIYLGSFVNEAEAAKAYNKAALEYYGKFAKLNILTNLN